VIQITRRQTVVPRSNRELTAVRERFQCDGHVKLAGLLEPSLLVAVLEAIDRTNFDRRIHDGIGVEMCAPSGAVSGVLEFVLNDPDLFTAISEMTGCGPIGCFEGRVYRMVPATEHYDSWHSDVGQDRLLALSINLGREAFEGGVLQIRRADSLDILAEVENRTAGDAVLFRIDSMLRHRVGPVTGGAPRTAYAGWFRSRPDFRDLLAVKLHAHATSESSQTDRALGPARGAHEQRPATRAGRLCP
jgi:hypothetical protein